MSRAINAILAGSGVALCASLALGLAVADVVVPAGPQRALTALSADPAVASAATTSARPAPPGTAPGAVRPRDTLPVKVLTLGDSISAPPGNWPARFCQLVTQQAGRPCVLTNPSVGGTACEYWPDKIAGLLASAQPDIVIIACGTNDSPTAMLYGEQAVSWSWRYTAEAARNAGALVIPTFIQYSNPNLDPRWDWLLTNEPQINDALYREFTRYPGRYPAPADFQKIPPTDDYLVQPTGPNDPGGIHPTALGTEVQAEIEFNATAAAESWPLLPYRCDLWGHRRGYPPYPQPSGCPALGSVTP